MDDHTPETFLLELYRDLEEGWLTLFTLDRTTGKRKTTWVSAEAPTDLLDAADPDLCCWFGVATRRQQLPGGKRGGANDCTAIPALWVDLDVAGPNHAAADLPPTLDDAHKLLDCHPLAPSAIVATGGGLQAWWFLDEPATIADYLEVSARWAHHWDAAGAMYGWHVDNTSDAARIMRLPGTTNTKTDPGVAVVVTEARYERRYGLSDLIEACDPLPVATAPTQGPGPLAVAGDRPGDHYNRTHTGAEILSSLGFTHAHTDPNGDTHWTRPGKSLKDGTSATVYADDGHTTIWSETCRSMWPAIATRRPYDPFGLWVATAHSGDFTAARRALATEAPRAELGTIEAPVTEQNPDIDLAHLVDWTSIWTRDRTDQQWLIWPLVPAGRAIALYAAAKVGKSTVILAGILAAVTGRNPYNGQPLERPVKVLYLDYEMTEDDLLERIEELGYGPDDDLSGLHYALLPSFAPLDTAEGARQVLELAVRLGVDLVVVDTFGRAVGGEENDADTVRDFYRHTGLRLKAAGIACLRTDHAGKDGGKGQRGSSAKNDDVDVVWRLVRTDDGLTLERTHTRVGWVPQKVELTRTEDERTGIVTYTVDGSHKAYVEGTRAKADELDHLGIPVDVSERQAIAMVKAKGGVPGKARLFRDALRYRRERALQAFQPVDNPPESASR